MFNQLGLKAEAIDLATNFKDIVATPAEEIRQHYFADALLAMPSSGHYHSLLEEAVFAESDSKGLSFVSAMTKAFIKDGNAEHAFKFYDE